jgi:hypothetical protein
MINISHVVHRPLPIQSASHRTWRSLDSMPQRIAGKILFFSNLEFKFLLMSQTFMLQGSNMGSTLVMP